MSGRYQFSIRAILFATLAVASILGAFRYSEAMLVGLGIIAGTVAGILFGVAVGMAKEGLAHGDRFGRYTRTGALIGGIAGAWALPLNTLVPWPAFLFCGLLAIIITAILGIRRGR